MSEEKKKKSVTPLDLFKGEYVSKEISEKRLDICRQCNKFLKITQQCKMCLCIMPAKTILAHASCPLDKWGPES